MPLKRIFVWFIVSFFSVSSIYSQIYAPLADDSITAKYGTDRVFIFNRPAFQAPIQASIVAVSPDKTTGWTFTWTLYSHANSAYLPTGITETGASSKISNITGISGYRVIMTKNAEVDTFRAWVVINDVDVKITNKDASDTLLFGYYNCSSIDLMADSTLIPKYYYNPFSHQKIAFPFTTQIRWTASNSEAALPSPSNRLLTRVSNPTAADTWYIITISDNFGLRRSDSVFYKAIQSEAHFKASYIPLEDDTIEYPNRPWIKWFYSPSERSAPGKYYFDVSESKNMVKYQIDFGDGDSATFNSDSTRIIHLYKRPGTYAVILTTISGAPYECIDTTANRSDVTLEYATAENFGEMPNVFTPDKDWNSTYKLPEDESLNDIFRTSEVSVVYIDITIFNRFGLKVHQYSGDIRAWHGWDGRIMDGPKAPEGVYFYVISKMVAYQDKNNPISKDSKKGFIHLYRND